MSAAARAKKLWFSTSCCQAGAPTAGATHPRVRFAVCERWSPGRTGSRRPKGGCSPCHYIVWASRNLTPQACRQRSGLPRGLDGGRRPPPRRRPRRPSSRAAQCPMPRAARRGARAGRLPGARRDSTSFPAEWPPAGPARRFSRRGSDRQKQEGRPCGPAWHYQHLVRELAPDSWIEGPPPGAAAAAGLPRDGHGQDAAGRRGAAALWDTTLTWYGGQGAQVASSARWPNVELQAPELTGAALAEAQAAVAVPARLPGRQQPGGLVARAAAARAGSPGGRLLIVDKARNLFRAIINSPDGSTNARRPPRW